MSHEPAPETAMSPTRRLSSIDPARRPRRRLARAIAAAALAAAVPAPLRADAVRGATATVPSAVGGTPIEVWYAPTCGCCKDWIAHLEREGFAVTGQAVGNHAIRRRLGLPERFGSCHTATVDGYVIEGHVPASDIRRLLALRPAVLGLAVPGMPVGSPGMDGPIYRGRRDPYDVLAVSRDGTATVFQSYR